MIRCGVVAALLTGLLLLAADPTRAIESQAVAVDRYRQALAADPDNLTLHYLLGVALLNADRNSEALEAFRRAYPAYRTSLEANFNLSLACLRLNDLDGALLYFDQAEALGIASQTDIYPAASLAFNLALRAQDNRQENEAVRLFDRVLYFDPERAEVYRQLGALYARRGDSERAISSFRQHLKAVPDDPVSRDFLFSLEFNRAQEALQQGDHVAAEQGLAAAGALKPDHPAVLYNLGYLAYQQQRPADAARLLSQALPHADRELRQALRPLLYNCSLDLRAAGKEDEALETSLQLADLPDANPGELFLAGSLCVSTGRFLDGKVLLERLLRIEPGHAGALKHLIAAETGAYRESVIIARQAINRDDFTAAAEALATAHTLQPANPQLTSLESQLRQKRLAAAERELAAAREALAAGDHAAAREALQRGLSLCPEDADGMSLQARFAREFAVERDRLLSVARTALAAGNWPEARSGYLAILSFEPDHAEASSGLHAAEQGEAGHIARLLREGQSALQDQRPQPARAAFTELLQLAPGHAGATAGLAEAERMLAGQARDFLQLGRRAAAQGKLSEARDYFEKARLIDDDGSARDALAHLDRARSERVATLLARADQGAKRGDYRQAQRLYTEILALEPGQAVAIEGNRQVSVRIAAIVQESLALGDDALRRNDLPNALAAFRRVLDLAPENSAAQSGLKRIRQQQTAQLSVLVVRGNSALAGGDLAEAGKAAEEALRLDPFNNEATRLQERIEQLRLGGARPGEEQTLYLQGVALYTRGSYQEAIRTWESVLALDPGFEKARQNIEKTRRKLRQIEEYRGG